MASPQRRTLAGRLLFIYAVAVLAVVILLGYFVERAAREALLDSVENGLVQEARAVADSMPEATSEVPGYVFRLAGDIDARVTVVGPDGIVIADSHADSEEMENHAGRPEIEAAYRGEVGSDRRISVTTGFAQLYVAAPGPNDMVVRLSLPENVVNAPITSLRSQLLLIVAAAGVLGILVVAVVARRLSRPLTALSEAASAVAAGDLGAVPPRSSVAELDDLGRSIGSMASELGARLDEVGNERRTLEVVLDAMPQGTLLIDSDDTVLYANPALSALLGPVPATLDQLVPFRVQETVRSARASGEVADLEVDHGAPARVLRVIVSPFVDGRVLVVVSDVTDRRRVDDVRRDFVTNASHELKTPVASILSNAETLQMALGTAPDRAPEFAAHIERSAQALARLVADLLDLSRLEGHSSESERVALEDVVVEEVERLRLTSAESGVDIEMETVPAVVLGTDHDLALAIRNILDNAVRYTDASGHVKVTLSVAEGQALVAVSDDGAGIPQRDLERIFERFYRVDVARSRATGGTGLGLSIVRHVVESHGGSVEVTSRFGVGSTFTIALPLAE